MLLIPRTLGNSNMMYSMIFDSHYLSSLTCAIVFDTTGYLQHFFHWAFTVFSWVFFFTCCFISTYFFVDPLDLRPFQFCVIQGSVLGSLLWLYWLLMDLGLSHNLQYHLHVGDPRFMFPVQMSFWMSDIQWPMNHIHHKLKISKLNSYFSSKPDFFLHFSIFQNNRIVFPFLRLKTLESSFSLSLTYTSYSSNIRSCRSTFRICPQTNHSAHHLSTCYAFSVWIIAVASDLFPYFLCPPIVYFQPRVYKNGLLKTFHQSESQLPPGGLWGHRQLDASAAAWPPVSSPPSSCLHSDPAL